ncbi:MAG: hypothetical protein AAGE52_22605 [Myxococcota bacterium]
MNEEENRSEADVRRARSQLKAAIVSQAAEQKRAKARRYAARSDPDEHARMQAEVARLRASLRAKLVVYAFLRGVPYRALERNPRHPVQPYHLAGPFRELSWTVERDELVRWLDA